MPITGSQKALMYAQSGVERCGATRTGYHSAYVYMTIGGVQVGHARTNDSQKVLLDSFSVTEESGDTPNTATATVIGLSPTPGQEVIVQYGSKNNLDKIFAGTILSVRQSFMGTPTTPCYDLTMIAYDWQLNRLKISGSYSGNAGTIARTLLPSGFTVGYIDSGLGTIDEITFDMQDLAKAYTQLAKRAGAYWFIDYRKRLFFFATADPSLTNPQTLTASLPTLKLDSFSYERDTGQRYTRATVEGGGAAALSDVSVGDTIIPVEDAPATWYGDSAGTVTAGVNRGITFTGRRQGGAGSLVGSGASPASAPIVAASTGAGIADGVHQYAVTYTTGSGESIVGPLASVTHGTVSAPSSAPTANTPTQGAGPDAGAHYYAVTFVNASGETTASPVSSTITTGTQTVTIPNPTSAPTLSNSGTGSGAWVGAYKFCYSYSGASSFANVAATANFTTLSPLSSEVTSDGTRFRLQIPYSTSPACTYIVVWRLVAGIYSGSNAARTYTDNPGGNSNFIFANNTAGGTLDVQIDGFNVTSSYESAYPNSNVGSGPVAYNTVSLTNIPIGSSSVTSRKLYRTAAGGSQLKLLATIANNSATTYTDTTADSGLGANIPVSNTATVNRSSLTGIPIGGSGVTGRKVYRTVAGGSQLKLLTTIADNTTTTYTDSTADASLGANAPSSDTSGLSQPSGVVLAGATSLIAAGVGFADSGGGWAIIGNGQQVIRYTGISGNTLTGIPASGVGAITASIAYNTTITAAPCLYGVPSSGAGSILYAIKKGDEVNILETVNDTAAQAEISAALDPSNVLGGAAGVIEYYRKDERISRTEALARAQATLTLMSPMYRVCAYQSQDRHLGPNKSQAIAMSAPTGVSDTLKIQRVTKAFTDANPPIFAVCEVEASSRLYSFEQILNQQQGQ